MFIVFLVYFLLLMSDLVTSDPIGETTLTVPPGESATLPCSTSEKVHDVAAVVVEWTRTDLNRSVLFFRDGRLYPGLQHRSLRGRVQLAHPDLKDGDLSMVLSDARRNDSGTYECRFIGARRRRSITGSRVLNVVLLTVQEKTLESRAGHGKDTEDHGDASERGRSGFYGMIVVGEAVLLFIVYHLYRKFRPRVLNKICSDTKVNVEQSELFLSG